MDEFSDKVADMNSDGIPENATDNQIKTLVNVTFNRGIKIYNELITDINDGAWLKQEESNAQPNWYDTELIKLFSGDAVANNKR